jgi:hypothetical protein
VIETTNPGLEQQIFTGEFKQQYANYLRNSKLISESEYKSKSVEEIFEENFKAVKDAEFNNLPGFQYYNKAVQAMQKNQRDEALKLAQKAYFFYPDNQVKMLLYNSLLFYIEKSNFDNVSDIDYLAQLSKFENTDAAMVAGIFSNIINAHLQYTKKEAFCDSLHERMVSQLSDKKLVKELSFNYYLQMSYHYQRSEKIEAFVTKALDIKGNHKDARTMFENHLQRKLYGTANPDALLDTVSQLDKRYNHDLMEPILLEHSLRAYLQKANTAISKKKIAEGEKFIAEFEQRSEIPLNIDGLNTLVESTYGSIAVHYLNKGNKAKAAAYIDKGKKYVPDSRMLESLLRL